MDVLETVEDAKMQLETLYDISDSETYRAQISILIDKIDKVIICLKQTQVV